MDTYLQHLPMDMSMDIYLWTFAMDIYQSTCAFGHLPIDLCLWSCAYGHLLTLQCHYNAVSGVQGS